MTRTQALRMAKANKARKIVDAELARHFDPDGRGLYRRATPAERRAMEWAQRNGKDWRFYRMDYDALHQQRMQENLYRFTKGENWI